MPALPTGLPDRTARHARVAVAVLFVANGLTYASLVPWLPAIKAQLSLTNTALGSAIAAGPLGALVVGATAARLIGRFGSARTATVAAMGAALALPAVAVAGSWFVLAMAMAVVGAADAVADAAMNVHGLRVQRRYGRSIINGFHSLWSLGAVTGGLVATTAVGVGIARAGHIGVVAGLLTVALVLAARWLLPGPEHTERRDEAGLAGGGARRAMRTAPMALLGLGVMLMMSGAIEDSAASWSPVYLRETLHADPFVAGLGFVAAQATMVIGRSVADRVVDRFGAALVARAGSLVAAAGVGLALAWPTPAAAIAGFGLAGLGVATLFPLGLAAAGEVDGVRSGDGVAVVSWLARVGFFAVPPLVGLVADATSLRTGLLIPVAAGLVAAALAGLLAPPTRGS